MRTDDQIALDVISTAGACVRTLRANKDASSSDLDPHCTVKRQPEFYLASSAVYCLEHKFGILNGNLANNARTFQAPAASSDDIRVRWMMGQVDYEICLEEIEGNEVQGGPHDFEASLESWKLSLPARYQDVDQPCSRGLTSDGKKLWIFCQYHEAILGLYTRKESSPSGDSNDWEHGIRSAAIVLEATNLLPLSVVLANS